MPDVGGRRSKVGGESAASEDTATTHSWFPEFQIGGGEWGRQATACGNRIDRSARFDKTPSSVEHAGATRRSTNMTAASVDVEEIAGRLRPAFVKHHISKAILFGSRAHPGASRHSDIDPILVKDTNERFLDRLKGLLFDLNNLSPGPSVEAFVYTPDEMRRMKGRRFIDAALATGKVISSSLL